MPGEKVDPRDNTLEEALVEGIPSKIRTLHYYSTDLYTPNAEVPSLYWGSHITKKTPILRVVVNAVGIVRLAGWDATSNQQ